MAFAAAIDRQYAPAPPAVSWLRRFGVGPGLLVAVGYMDPGNWATDIAAGSTFGYHLLWVVLLAGGAAIILQLLAARLGLVTNRDLASWCRTRYSRHTNVLLWAPAQFAIVACELAEVLGSALAFRLLFNMPIAAGVVASALLMLLICGLRRTQLDLVEIVVLAMTVIVAGGILCELSMAPVRWGQVGTGLLPDGKITQAHAVTIAVSILGATIMPHNLYLHSAMVDAPGEGSALQRALRQGRGDVFRSLTLAALVNAGIVILATAALRGRTGTELDIGQAYRMLEPVAGPAARIIFGVALLASGISATLTGSIAGQVVFEGFLRLGWSLDLQRLVTRASSTLPTLVAVFWMGEAGVGKLLLWSQVVLSFQLPFALGPLIIMTSDKAVMGPHAVRGALQYMAWAILLIVVAANMYLLWTMKNAV